MSLLPAVVVLIALNGLFVLVEYAVVRVRSSRIEMLARRGSTRALSVQHILTNLDQYLAAIQVALTVISLALGSTAEPALAGRLHELFLKIGVPHLRHGFVHALAFAVGLVVLSFVQIVCAELVPRAIGIQKSESIALWAALPLKGFAKIVSLPVFVMSACSTALLRLFGMKPAANAESVVSEEEMRILLGETQEKGAIPLERLLLLENLFDVGSAKAGEAMTARERVHVLSLARGWEENLALIRAKKFTRYPLCEKDDLDSVIGYVNIKDLVMRPELGLSGPDLRAARRDLPETTEAEPLEKLLKVYPDKGINMALVRDAHGRAVGILTLEDMIEELVGEVHDEFDRSHAWSLMDVLVPQAVAVGLQAEDRREAIVRLIDRLALTEPALKAKDVLQVVWDRELKFSSAVGRGVAVPHGRLHGWDKPLVAVGRFAKPVPFPSPDNVPVRLVFLILTPAQTPVIQLKVLGRIAAIVTNETLRRKLLRAKSGEALTELLRTADTLLA